MDVRESLDLAWARAKAWRRARLWGVPNWHKSTVRCSCAQRASPRLCSGRSFAVCASRCLTGKTGSFSCLLIAGHWSLVADNSLTAASPQHNLDILAHYLPVVYYYVLGNTFESDTRRGNPYGWALLAIGCKRPRRRRRKPRTKRSSQQEMRPQHPRNSWCDTCLLYGDANLHEKHKNGSLLA